MAYLEADSARDPFHGAPGPKELSLPDEQKLAHAAKLPMFEGILDDLYETRPGAGKPQKVLVRDVIGRHCRIFEVPAGTPIFQEGSFGEQLFVLLRGRARSSTSFALDAERVATVPIGELAAGDFCGEHSAFTMNAHLITVEAVEPSLLLLVPQFIAQELLVSHEGFRNVVMQSYVTRAVQTLIRRLPALRYASPEEYDRLLQKTELRSYDVGDVIFEEGDPSEEVFVVSEGFVKIAKRDAGKQRVLAYLVEGDGLGEGGVLEGKPRGTSAIGMSSVQLLAIPGADFRALVESNPAAASEVKALENLKKLEADLAENVTFVGQRLEFQAEVMPNLDVLVINQNLCVRCDNCVKACAAAHEDGFSRLIRKGVTFEEVLLPTACRSCRDPSCLLCKSGGIKRDKDGDIYFTESCIGCSGCAQRCPYGNITMVDTDEMGKPPVPTLLSLALRRGERRTDVPQETDQRPKLKKIPVKCDLDKDHLFPACVNSCPTGAIKRYRTEEIDQILSGVPR